MDCHFCLTAQLGLIRNLTAGRNRGTGARGAGGKSRATGAANQRGADGPGRAVAELRRDDGCGAHMLDPKGVALAPRHVTLSTSGIVPGIERLAQEKIRPSLAISLNASSDEQRDALMPINRKYPLAMLLEACRSYPLRPREYFTFEYVLLGGVNDSPEDARRVVRLLAQHPRKSEFDSLESRRPAVSRAHRGEHRGISAKFWSRKECPRSCVIRAGRMYSLRAASSR